MTLNPAEFSKPDFPDWLSPMLVKELRQGMRSRVFLMSFLAVQAALIFPALIGLLSASQNDPTDGVTVFFWMIVGAPLLLIMPFSGLSAISREKSANTLELIFLTHLSARRIVFGKWVAIVAQMLLLLSAVLPYAVLRYYLGGVDVATELTALAWMVGCSALLTSITVGISPAIGRVARVILPVVLLLGMQMFGVFLAVPGSPILRGGSLGWQFYTALGLEAVCLMLLMLEFGAEKIAPIAENHATPKRLIALVSVLTAVIYSYTPGAEWSIGIAALFIAGPVMIGSVCEPVREVPSVYRPFLRMGFMGRALGRLLYPGWPGGVFFSLLLLGLAEFRLYEMMNAPAPWRATATPLLAMEHLMDGIKYAAILGAFFTPVAFFRLLRVKLPYPTVFYFVIQGILALVALVGVLATQFSPHHPFKPGPSDLEQFIAFIPTCAIFLSSRFESWNPAQLTQTLFGLSIVTGVVMLAIFALMWPAWRRISALEKTAADVAPAASPADAA